MEIFIDFLRKMSPADRALCEQAEALYRAIFESSAVDINRRQLAADKGITQQGIVPNENLSNLDDNPFGATDSTVEQLINSSYAARFGQHSGEVSPGAASRTSNGMYGGCSPQNTNASCDAPGN